MTNQINKISIYIVLIAIVDIAMIAAAYTSYQTNYSILYSTIFLSLLGVGLLLVKDTYQLVKNTRNVSKDESYFDDEDDFDDHNNFDDEDEDEF